MEDKNFFKSVPGLFIPYNVNQDEMLAEITNFISEVPVLIVHMQNSLDGNNLVHFVRSVKSVLKLLQKIYAKRLETDADSLIRAGNTKDLEFCVKALSPFIMELRSLSIALQMAQVQAIQGVEHDNSELETYTEVIRNLQSIGKLIKNAEFGRAAEMLSQIDMVEEDSESKSLTELLREGVADNIDKTFSDLMERYKEYFLDLGGKRDDIMHKVLAVDDRPALLGTLCNVLKDYYKVFPLTSGHAALKYLNRESPDLFILDIEMPEMDGFELAKAIRAMPQFKTTPILFLTGNATKEYVEHAILAGTNDFIVKPVNKEIMLAKLSHYLR
jgi:PleD family two-component response regulator